MITVTFVKNQDRKITGLFMEGHAGYAEEGSDIICAGASTLLYTAVNALDSICGYQDIARIEEDNGDGNVYAEVIIPPDGIVARADTAQTIMRTVEVGLITLASSVNTDGNRYVEIKEKI